MRGTLVPLFFVLGMWNLSPALAKETSSSISLTQLAEQTAWQRLGHWQKKFARGWVSDVDGPNFFLASDGKHNPLAELNATLEAFAQPLSGDEASHAQCRYPARRAWLLQNLPTANFPILPCRAHSAWKKRFNAEAVSVIFASAYMGNSASLFGHTFLKFHSRDNRDDRDLLDYGVSFLAQTGPGAPFALYGLIGLYPGQFSLEPYHQTLREYTSLEGRDIWEYRLGLSAADVDRLIDHLMELEKTYFDYYFIDENCSYQILAALEAARPDLDLTDRFHVGVIPADSIRRLTRTPGLVTATRYRPSLTTVFRASLQPLSGAQRELVKELVLAPHLENTTQVAVLDAALAYIDLLENKTPGKYRQRAHELRSLRARLGGDSDPRQLATAATVNATRPEQGDDSARVGIGIGTRDRVDFKEVQFRFAYHNLLSDDAGADPGSHLEVLRTTVRAFDTNLELHEATLLDLISLAPSDRFFHPLAWRVNAGWGRLADRPVTDAGASRLNGGVGYAIEPWSRRWMLFSFAQLHTDAGHDLEYQYRVGASLEVQTIFSPWRAFKINLGTSARRDFFGAKGTFPSSWAKLNFSLRHDLELGLNAQRIDRTQELAAMLYWSFLL